MKNDVSLMFDASTGPQEICDYYLKLLDTLRVSAPRQRSTMVNPIYKASELVRNIKQVNAIEQPRFNFWFSVE